LRADEVCAGQEQCPDAVKNEHGRPVGPCESCDLETLQACLRTTPAGVRLGGLLELEAAMKVGVRVGLDDVTTQDVQDLLMIGREREKVRAERDERNPTLPDLPTGAAN
jgi:hypothetical protein